MTEKQRQVLFVIVVGVAVSTMCVGAVAAQENNNEPVFSPSTGHYYEPVEAESITWQDARDAAAQRTHNGMQGYLATVTSQAEDDFIVSTFKNKSWVGDDNSGDDGLWIGASDAANEGTWRWVTGPEGQKDNGRGLHFFTQDLSEDGNGQPNGRAVNDNYEGWNADEPNEVRGGPEDYAHYFSPGVKDGDLWNDNRNNRNDIDGYIIEYGGLSSGGELSPDNPFGDSNNNPVDRSTVIDRVVEWNLNGEIGGTTYTRQEIIDFVVGWNLAQ
jgi:hypothetical protein